MISARSGIRTHASITIPEHPIRLNQSNFEKPQNKQKRWPSGLRHEIQAIKYVRHTSSNYATDSA
uniref:Uncharacterized protein n=1 Tax=Setaria digitata TaxID=48799 RepID=A0A915PXG0_9BILA